MKNSKLLISMSLIIVILIAVIGFLGVKVLDTSSNIASGDSHEPEYTSTTEKLTEESVSETETTTQLSETTTAVEAYTNAVEVAQTAALTTTVKTSYEDSNLSTEPLPSSSASQNPRIVSASTLNGEVLPDSNVNKNRTFGANKAIDGYYDSCWCVNTVNKSGAGAKIKFTLSEKSYINGVKLINGNLYMPEDELYSLNGQIKNFTLTFSDGTSRSFVASNNSNASSGYQVFELPSPVISDYIILTVDSGYTGSLYDTNVCLGEFAVY